MYRAAPKEVARVLHRCAVHDPYILVFGPDNADAPGRFLLRVMLAVPEDRGTGHCWAAASLAQVREMIPHSLVRWPAIRTVPQPALVEQWCLRR